MRIRTHSADNFYFLNRNSRAAAGYSSIVNKGIKEYKEGVVSDQLSRR